MSDLKSSNKNDLGWLVADHVNAMLAYWDKDQFCRFANNTYLKWFGKTPEEMIGKITMKELLGPLYEKNLPYILKALKGETQVFEREIPLPSGEIRHTLATYHPDIADGIVRGFFVHVADVTPIKVLEKKLIEFQHTKKREILRSVFEAQEMEKEAIAHELRDSVSQTLAYCKMMLQDIVSKEPGGTRFSDIANYTQQAIHDLNVLSRNLTPSVVTHFGLKAGIEDHIAELKRRTKSPIHFIWENEKSTSLPVSDKVAVFRIIQDFLLLVAFDQFAPRISMLVQYNFPKVLLRLGYSALHTPFQSQRREFKDIENRVEYYYGSIKKNCDTEKAEDYIQIELNMTVQES